MALFEKFGEMNSAEELVMAAEGLIEEGDKDSLLILFMLISACFCVV